MRSMQDFSDCSLHIVHVETEAFFGACTLMVGALRLIEHVSKAEKDHAGARNSFSRRTAPR